jgi:methyl-accepting chemotaxis protein
MTTPSLVTSAPQTQTQGLERFLTWLLRANTFFTAVLIISLIDNFSSDGLITTAMVSTAGLIYWGARRLVHQGKVNEAVMLICGVVLSLGLIIALTTVPRALPTIIPLPVIAVAIGLLYMRRALLYRLLILSGGVLLLMPSANKYLSRATPVDNFINEMVILVGPAIVSGLVLFLLWQFKSRMQESLDEAHAANAALIAIQHDLEAQVHESQQLREQDAENTLRLEQSVADYLALVERLAEGKLETRLQAAHEGLLGRLTRGLNSMAERLEASNREEARLRRAELDHTQELERTVQEYLAFVRDVAQGSLHRRLSVQEDGALGQLGAGLNHMVDSLHSVTSQVQGAAANISEAAAKILSATIEQASSANEQSAAMSQTTTSMAEVKAIALQTEQQASQSADESQAALQAARQGAAAVENMVGGMEQIRGQVESIAQTILSLSDQTQAIGTIIQTVNDLADQSNLLALNAAIEAARAGEQGKSFAVVAQHVRELAERSKRATTQVREILGEIQHTANAAVLVTEEGTKGVTAGAALARQAGAMILRITAEVERGVQANVEMAGAAQQQTAGIGQISRAVEAVNRATEHALRSTRLAERTAQDLNALAGSLETAIATYQL